MALPEGLRRGDLVLVDARRLSGTAAGLYVVDRIPAAGELHDGEVLVIPAADLVLSRHLWVRSEHIIHGYPPSSTGLAQLPTAYVAPGPREPTKAERYAARIAEIEAEEKVAIDVSNASPGQSTYRRDRPDQVHGALSIDYQVVDGIVWIPKADEHPFLSTVAGSRPAAGAELKQAARLKAIREKEASRH